MVEVEEKTRDIPVWLTGIVLILCVLGGGWLIRWYSRDQGTQTVEVPLEDPATLAAAAKFRGPLSDYAPGRNGRAPNRGDDGTPAKVDGVRSSGNSGNAWIVRAGEATMYVSLDKRGQLDLNPSYVRQMLTPEQSQVLLMRRRLLTDAAVREQIKLTDEQLAALKRVDDFRGMVMDAADKAKLAQLFQAWRAAQGDKSAPERALVAALADAAKRCAEPTKAFDASRVDQVRKILTPDQLKLFNGGTPAAPTPAPAAPKATPGKPV
jgi:hypothetical protein